VVTFFSQVLRNVWDLMICIAVYSGAVMFSREFERKNRRLESPTRLRLNPSMRRQSDTVTSTLQLCHLLTSQTTWLVVSGSEPRKVIGDALEESKIPRGKGNVSNQRLY